MAPHNYNTNKQSATKRVKKTAHSRSYPRGVGLDFRKLAGLTLQSFIDYHGVKVRPEAPPSELAVAVARHFEAMEVNGEESIGGFLERLNEGASASTSYSQNTQFFDGSRSQPKRKMSKWAATPGEQIAAKASRNEENGSWILASVQRYYPETEAYDVRDEDDKTRIIRLPLTNVMRLSTGSEGCFDKGTECFAVFPETTSFYKAKISKSPIWELDHGDPVIKEIIVKFEDDEDSNGNTPHRRVPSRFVIQPPVEYFYDEHEDFDLTPIPTAG